MSAWSRLRREDEGQLLLLVLAYAVIAGLLVTVVVDVSQAFLYRRSLLAAADAAALAAANAPDLDRLYTGEASTRETSPLLPLSDRASRQAVTQYVRDARLADRFDEFQVRDVRSDGATVTVTLRAVVHLPIVTLVSARWRGGYPVDAGATARSPLTP
ncbi:MAG: pilus assembly protein TadG-related protein [Actinomycetes bacterium]